ncbi:unnamed protein product [Spirodela intermedia]|uniref:Exostosin GT47 domain-containing protein n=1 Tax=Spirodela intermedia TaxID=51605 RepID=A0A7I8IL56_SPIIN|nr:unnamed protein product [Spirodela intermedia]CAA6658485.1 unnamed protein product [Spirodela intermedia]
MLPPASFSLFYLAPGALAIFSAVVILLVYGPATSVLHLQWRQSTAGLPGHLEIAAANNVSPAGDEQKLQDLCLPHRRDDPFAHALLPVDFEPGGNYASESYFKKLLMESHFITKDPSEASLFFLPFSIARLRHDQRVNVNGIADFVRGYISRIRQNYPYWDRTGGADHFYVACHSTGRSAMDRAEEVKLNAIQVVCSASYFLSGYVAHKDVCLPQIWPRKGNPPSIRSSRVDQILVPFENPRSKLAFFAGSINSPVREMLLRAWENDSEISVHHGRLPTPYPEALLSSKFCLHVKGFEVNTARIADAIFYGCVPVIIANHYDLPFSDILNWKSFSLVVATLDIPLLREILRGLTLEEYLQMHENLLKVRKHFRWHLNPRLRRLPHGPISGSHPQKDGRNSKQNTKDGGSAAGFLGNSVKIS